MRQHIPTIWCAIIRTRPMWGMIPVRVIFGVILILQAVERLVYFQRNDESIIATLPSEWAFVILLVFSIVEMLAGALAIPGLLVRFAGLALVLELFASIVVERIPLDFSRDLQTQMLLLAIAALMFISGAGRYSVDHWLARRHLKKHPNQKWELYVHAETPYAKWWE